MYRHYVHTCLIIGNDDNHDTSQQWTPTYKHIYLYMYIAHTGYHSDIHVYTICYQVSDSSTKSKLLAILITLLGVFTSQLLN